MDMLNLILTEECNWNCKYCLFPQIKKPNRTNIKIIRRHLHYVKKIFKIVSNEYTMNLMIQGGEVGTLPEEVLEFLFTEWGMDIDVSTNGEFVRRGFHKNPKIRKYVKRIMLHIADPIGPYKIKLDYDFKDPEIFMDTGICDVEKDPDNLVSFIKMNSNIRFDFVDYEQDINKECSDNSNLYIELYEKLLPLENVTEQAKERIKKRYELNKGKEIKDKQNLCRQLNPTFFVDLVRETIPLCIRNYGKTFIPLNEENFKKTISEVNIFNFENCTCKNCFRICQNQGTDIGIYSKKIKYKKELLKWNLKNF